jgi:hypothetical protein
VPASGRSFWRLTRIWPTTPARLSLRRTPPLRQLPSQAPGHSPPTSRAPLSPTELLLRSRRLPPARHAPVGPVPGPNRLPRRHRHPHQRPAARALATTAPRAVRSFRRRSADHRPLAGLLARTLSPDPVLEDRSRPLGVTDRGRLPPLRPGGCLPQPTSSLQGLDPPAAIPRTGLDPRCPPNRGLTMIAFLPQKMLVARSD